MMNAEDCRRRAAESFAAEAATDPKPVRACAAFLTHGLRWLGRLRKTLILSGSGMPQGTNLIKRDLAKLIPTPHKSQISCVIACNSAILMGQSPNPGTDLFF
jgi:hypothetical protein